MAAVTVNSSNYVNGVGGRRVLTANINVNNTNTMNTGFSMIDSVQVESSAQVILGATIAGGVLTFAASGNDPAANLVVIGV